MVWVPDPIQESPYGVCMECYSRGRFGEEVVENSRCPHCECPMCLDCIADDLCTTDACRKRKEKADE